MKKNMFYAYLFNPVLLLSTNMYFVSVNSSSSSSFQTEDLSNTNTSPVAQSGVKPVISDLSEAMIDEDKEALSVLRSLWLSTGEDERQLAEKVNWIKTMAEQNHANSQFILGIMYMYGKGVEHDGQAAISLWKTAAEQLGDAAYILGEMYARGWQGIVDKNNAEAFSWIRKAAEHGYTSERLDELFKALKTEQSTAEKKSFDQLKKAAIDGSKWDKYLFALVCADMGKQEEAIQYIQESVEIDTYSDPARRLISAIKSGSPFNYR